MNAVRAWRKIWLKRSDITKKRLKWVWSRRRFVNILSICKLRICWLLICYLLICWLLICYLLICYLLICWLLICYLLICYLLICYLLICYLPICYLPICYLLISNIIQKAAEMGLVDTKVCQNFVYLSIVWWFVNNCVYSSVTYSYIKCMFIRDVCICG